VDALHEQLEAETRLELDERSTSTGGSSPRRATTSHRPISPLTVKPWPSRKAFTGA
jgi:hypothetical protein